MVQDRCQGTLGEVWPQEHPALGDEVDLTERGRTHDKCPEGGDGLHQRVVVVAQRRAERHYALDVRVADHHAQPLAHRVRLDERREPPQPARLLLRVVRVRPPRRHRHAWRDGERVADVT